MPLIGQAGQVAGMDTAGSCRHDERAFDNREDRKDRKDRKDREDREENIFVGFARIILAGAYAGLHLPPAAK